MGAPLSPSELAQRNRLAAHARALNGALHQDEAPTPQDPLGDGSYRGPDERAPLPARIEPETHPTDVWIATETGLRRWRPIIDRLNIESMPNGERILDIGGHRLRLNEATAAHVARLLYPAIDREGI